MNLEFRIRQALGLTADSAIANPRWANVKRHYEDQITKGMTVSYASVLALEDLEGKAWHRWPKRRRRNQAAAAKHEPKLGEVA